MKKIVILLLLFVVLSCSNNVADLEKVISSNIELRGNVYTPRFNQGVVIGLSFITMMKIW